eukprot:2821527-Amphidinium_carterae.1
MQLGRHTSGQCNTRLMRPSINSLPFSCTCKNPLWGSLNDGLTGALVCRNHDVMFRTQAPVAPGMLDFAEELDVTAIGEDMQDLNSLTNDSTEQVKCKRLPTGGPANVWGGEHRMLSSCVARSIDCFRDRVPVDILICLCVGARSDQLPRVDQPQRPNDIRGQLAGNTARYR